MKKIYYYPWGTMFLIFDKYTLVKQIGKKQFGIPRIITKQYLENLIEAGTFIFIGNIKDGQKK